MKVFKSLAKRNVALYAVLTLVLSVISVKQNLSAKALSEHTKRHRDFEQKLDVLTKAKAIKGTTLEEKHLNMAKAGLLQVVRFNPAKLSADKWYETLEKLGASPLRTLPSVNAVVVYAEADAVKKIQKLSSVKSVYTDQIATKNNCGGADGGSECAISNPPTKEMQWNIPDTKVDKVWPLGTGCGVKVCVVDSGIDTTHPDLVDRFQGGLNLVAGDDCVKDGNGDPIDPDLESDKNVCDSLGHGTHVSGIIAGSVNGLGVVGMAPGAEIYSGRVFGSYGSTTFSIITEAIAYCNEINADVLSMSLGGGGSDTAMEEEIQRALDRGAAVVVAAGNSGNGDPYDGVKDNVGFPGRLPGVFTVSASDENDNFAQFSSEGPAVDIMAPGTTEFLWEDPKDPTQWYNKGIFSSVAGYAVEETETPHFDGDTDEINGKRRLGRMSGTSMATPHVAGAVAVLKGLFPERSGSEIVNALKAGATDRGLPANRQGAGLMNVEAAFNILDAGN